MKPHTSPADRQKCLDAGMDDFLSKPVVQATLERAIGRARAALEAAGALSGGPGAGRLAGPTGEVAPDPPPAHSAGTASEAAPPGPAEKPAPAGPMLGGFDPATARSLADLFQRTSAELVKRLQAACDPPGAPALAAAAHGLKGSARHLGATRLGELTAGLETAAQADELGEVAEQVAAIADECAAVNVRLSAELGDGRAETAAADPAAS